MLTLATQLGTWPLGAAVFLQFAPYAVVANLAVVPCVALTMALGAAQLALSWCAPLAQACANLNSWLLAWMLGVVGRVAASAAAMLPMTPAPAWCIALVRRRAARGTGCFGSRGARTPAAAAPAACNQFRALAAATFDGRLRITVLDVGQADAIVDSNAARPRAAG